MPTSPIHTCIASSPSANMCILSHSTVSTSSSFECTPSIKEHFDEEPEIEIKTLEKFRFGRGPALLRKQISRPIILHAQKSTFGKRRFTFSGNSDQKVVCKRRRRLASVALPTKFLLGGDITDPLNLRSLEDDRINKQLNAFSPARSPLTIAARRNQVQVLVPPNIYDPLNLNAGNDLGISLLSSKPRKRRRHRKSRREEGDFVEETEKPFSTDLLVPLCELPILPHPQGILTLAFLPGLEKAFEDSSTHSLSSPEDKNIFPGSSSHSLSSKIISPLITEHITRSNTCANLNYSFSTQDSFSKLETFSVSACSSFSKSDTPVISLKSIKPYFFKPDCLTTSSNSTFSENKSGLPLCYMPINIATSSNSSSKTVLSGSPIKSHSSASFPTSSAKVLSPIKYLSFSASTSNSFDKIVSPVLPQGSPVKLQRQFSSQSTPKDNEEKSSQRLALKRKRSKARHRQKVDAAKFRANAEKFCYGNHVPNFSNWNFGDNSGEDQRLRFFNRNLFRNKDVLDIGCNTGQMTLFIAKHFEPNKVIGLDIDKKLINNAQRQVRLHINSGASGATNFPDSMSVLYGPLAKFAVVSGNSTNDYPNNVTFFEANYVPACEDDLETQKAEYDTILCLRVAKWIHLNFGDDGIKMAFKRMYAQLRYGGHLIFEPQPWFTYSASKRITPAMLETYRSLQMRPESFCDYLLSHDVGFASCQLIGSTYNYAKDYRQPIYLLSKGYGNAHGHSLLMNFSPIHTHFTFHNDHWIDDEC